MLWHIIYIAWLFIYFLFLVMIHFLSVIKNWLSIGSQLEKSEAQVS